MARVIQIRLQILQLFHMTKQIIHRLLSKIMALQSLYLYPKNSNKFSLHKNNNNVYFKVPLKGVKAMKHRNITFNTKKYMGI